MLAVSSTRTHGCILDKRWSNVRKTSFSRPPLPASYVTLPSPARIPGSNQELQDGVRSGSCLPPKCTTRSVDAARSSFSVLKGTLGGVGQSLITQQGRGSYLPWNDDFVSLSTPPSSSGTAIVSILLLHILWNAICAFP